MVTLSPETAGILNDVEGSLRKVGVEPRDEE